MRYFLTNAMYNFDHSPRAIFATYTFLFCILFDLNFLGRIILSFLPSLFYSGLRLLFDASNAERNR